MRAGGITVVGAYVFWLLHEERRGSFRWDGDLDLRAFIELCQEVGLEVVARIGPWGHGEARNGAFPDWLQDLNLRTRTNDPAYLDIVRPWYAEIARQLDGLFWVDGGPIIAVQIENELYDQPDHLRTLKELAKEVGFDVPLWTVTGWGRAAIPRDEFIPLFGGYPEAAWDEHDAGWARQSRLHYFFTHVRDDFTIGSDLRGDSDTTATGDTGDGGEVGGAVGGHAEGATGPELERYPFATCELGGGMYTAYHRRPRIPADDIAAISLVKIGSGSTWQGYYMYHGGTQVVGELSTTQESHATGYPNDCPVLTYDFQAPLGEFGQVRPSFALLRQQATWVASEGEQLARMVTTLPDEGPADVDDRETLRWSVRSDGEAGYLFVNNHQPVETLAEHHDVQFEVAGVGDGPLVLPRSRCSIAAGAYFAWPLRIDVAGARLSATAQVVTHAQVQGRDMIVLAATAGIPVELHLEGGSVLRRPEGSAVTDGGAPVVDGLTPGRDCVVTMTGPHGEVDLLVLDHEDGLAVNVVDDDIWLCADPVVGHDDGPRVVTMRSGNAARLEAGAWHTVDYDGPAQAADVRTSELRAAEAPRSIPRGGSLRRASAPVDADFAAAAAWQLDGNALIAALPDGDGTADDELVIRIDYVGDVARLYAGDRLLADHFWYGSAWEVGIRRFAEALTHGGVRLEVLPLAEDAPIYLSPDARPDFTDGVALELRGVTAQQRRSVRLA